MSLIRHLNTGIQHLKVLKTMQTIPDQYWSEKIREFRLNPQSVRFDSVNQRLFVEELGIKLSKKKHEFLLHSLDLIRQLNHSIGITFELDQEEVIACIDGIRVYVQTWEDLLILKEIFTDGLYNILSPKPVVILDIGMNVGFASLYFATKPNILAVIGYEPMQKTYDQALRNFALNPQLAEKLKPQSYGLSDQTENLTVDYCYAYKGSVGYGGLPQWVQTEETVSREEMQLKQACEAFEQILQDYPDQDLIAKLDCEGSEYSIIKSLWSGGKLHHLKSILLEWHQHQKNEALLQQLAEAGFSSVFLNPHSQNFGMLYASKF